MVDYAYAPESYDATILAALGAAAAKSDAGVDVAKQLVKITNGTEVCNDYAGCIELMNQGKDIDYNGRSGAVNFWDAGDPTSASIGVYQFGPDNTLLPDVTYMQGEIVPEGEANAIDGKPQKGANDGTWVVGTLLPVTGSLAFLGPPEVAGVQLAINDIEAAGGIPGFDKIVLEEGDSGDTSTNTATQTVKRLLAKDVDVIIGARLVRCHAEHPGPGHEQWRAADLAGEHLAGADHRSRPRPVLAYRPVRRSSGRIRWFARPPGRLHQGCDHVPAGLVR